MNRAISSKNTSYTMSPQSISSDITNHAERTAKGEGKARIDLIATLFATLGDHRKPGRIAVVWLVSSAIMSAIVFFCAHEFGL